MVFNPVYDSISALCARKGETVQSVVEGAFTLAGLVEVLNVTCSVKVIRAEIADGYAKAEGVIDYKILYLAAENELKCENASLQFVAKAPSNLKNAGVKAKSVVVDSGISAVRGEEVKLASVVDTCFLYTECESITCLSTTSSGFYLKDTHESYVACRCEDKVKTEYSLSDKTLMDEVVYARGTCVINKRTAAVESVCVEGEVILETVGVKKGEICSQTLVMPYSETFECNGAGYGDTVVASVNVTYSDAVVIADGDGSKLDGIVRCDFDFATYAEHEFPAVCDVFSIKKQLLPTVKSHNVCEKMSNFTVLERVDGNVVLGDDMPACDVILSSCAFDAVINSVKSEEGSVSVEGVVSGRVIYSCSSPQKTVSTLVVAPFSFTTLVPLKGNEDIIANATVTAVNCRVRRGNEIDIKADLSVSITAFKSKELVVISQLEEGEDIVVPTSAFSVYVAEGGEGVWDVAGVLGATPDAVVEQNGKISFPLAKGDRITVYRTLDSKKI